MQKNAAGSKYVSGGAVLIWGEKIPAKNV